jgi:hypothetical protein
MFKNPVHNKNNEQVETICFLTITQKLYINDNNKNVCVCEGFVMCGCFW